MADDTLQPEKHRCGVCMEEFKTEDEYLDHECSETGFTPREPEHLGQDFQSVSQAAVERGEEQKEKNTRKSKTQNDQ